MNVPQCPYCGELHPPESLCPPHEVRNRGYVNPAKAEMLKELGLTERERTMLEGITVFDEAEAILNGLTVADEALEKH